jgi:hypothetical protein
MSSEHKGGGFNSPSLLSKEQVDSLIEAYTGDGLRTVYVDFSANRPKTEQAKDEFREQLQIRFDKNLPDAVDRMFELPPLVLQTPDGEYLNLLLEARQLFVTGYFYSCVAMCGIVGERLVKDLLRASLLILRVAGPERPTDAAFDQLERVEISALLQFVGEAELLEDGPRTAAKKLLEMRNQYAHARGKNPFEDAKKAIGWLHALVEGTVSLLKDFEIKDGRFVPKTAKS